MSTVEETIAEARRSLRNWSSQSYVDRHSAEVAREEMVRLARVCVQAMGLVLQRPIEGDLEQDGRRGMFTVTIHVQFIDPPLTVQETKARNIPLTADNVIGAEGNT